MLFALLVMVVSLLGAAIPLWTRLSHSRLQIYLSLAAGALLGAAAFHLLPEATHLIDEEFGIPFVIGIMLVFLLQRYVAPHSHEAEHIISESPTDHHHDHDHHDHHHDHTHAAEQQIGTAAPILSNLIAILALSVHSLLDGVALGAALNAPSLDHTLVYSVLISILIHKPMDGLSVAVLLIKNQTSKPRFWGVQIGYAALVPIGVLLYSLSQEVISTAAQSSYLGYTLAFSAGIFCSIALTDLLPELHFHKHDRHLLTGALFLGLGVMLVTHLLEPPHAHHTHETDPAHTATNPIENVPEHVADHDHDHESTHP
ncbi:MAG: Zinc transporter ZupT [Phycisphaerae bacterium]|nr:Zinc transporter ZupT [Phycisphaerae bacterium]